MSSRPQTGPIATSTGAAHDRRRLDYGQHFAGRIDEVRVYSAALTQAQIQADMATAIGGGPAPGPASERPRHSDRDRDQPDPDQPHLDRRHRQRRRPPVPDRALPGRQLQHLHRDRDQQPGRPTPTPDAHPATSYTYRVRAQDAALNLGPYSNTATAKTPAAPGHQPPSAPGTLTATAVSPTQVNLAWTAATDDVGILQYRIERCQGASCSTFTEIATTTGTTYADTGRSPSTSYTYRVRAQDTALNLGPYSTTATAQTPAPPAPASERPRHLTATATNPTQVNLAWTAATDDVGILQYRIERCQGASCSTFTEIATTTGTTYADTGRSPSTSYTYRVRAQDTALTLGPYSTTATAQTPAAAPAKPLYFSLLSNGTIGGLSTANEDVVSFDGVAAFTLAADGSDVGLATSRVDAIAWLDADTLLFSLDTDGAVLPGVAETIDDSDVIRFDASSLGTTTSGTFSMYFDGSDVGLTTTAEDVDALELLTNGNLLLSTEGAVGVTGVSGDDKDLLAFTPATLGSATSGTFASTSTLRRRSDHHRRGRRRGRRRCGGTDLPVDAQRLHAWPASAARTRTCSSSPRPRSGRRTTGTFDPTLYFDGSAFALDSNDLNAIDLPPGV